MGGRRPDGLVFVSSVGASNGPLDSLWIQPRDRRAVQMSSERGIPAFSGRVDGAIGNARL